MSTPFQDFFNPPASSPSLSAKFIPLIRKLGSPLCEELVEDVIYGGSLRRTDSNFYRACMSKKGGGGGGSSLLHAPFLPSLSLALPINRFPLSSSGKSRDWTRKEGREDGTTRDHLGRREEGKWIKKVTTAAEDEGKGKVRSSPGLESVVKCLVKQR